MTQWRETLGEKVLSKHGGKLRSHLSWHLKDEGPTMGNGDGSIGNLCCQNEFNGQRWTMVPVGLVRMS